MGVNAITKASATSKSVENTKKQRNDDNDICFGEVLFEAIRRGGGNFRELKAEHRNFGYEMGLYQLRG